VVYVYLLKSGPEGMSVVEKCEKLLSSEELCVPGWVDGWIDDIFLFHLEVWCQVCSLVRFSHNLSLPYIMTWKVPVLTHFGVCSFPLSVILTYRSSYTCYCVQITMVAVSYRSSLFISQRNVTFFVDELVIHMSNVLPMHCLILQLTSFLLCYCCCYYYYYYYYYYYF
jgi:hypothetical protein